MAPPSTHELWAWNLDAWDEVVEVGLHSATGRMRLTSFSFRGPSPEPVLTVAGPGAYRLRVHARGRDRNPDGVDEKPAERYHLVPGLPGTPESATSS